FPTNGRTLRQLDVHNAFLNGHLSGTVYMKQPPGYEDPAHPGHVRHLERSLNALMLCFIFGFYTYDAIVISIVILVIKGLNYLYLAIVVSRWELGHILEHSLLNLNFAPWDRANLLRDFI
ncbi:reverse transcriptase domain-containing protein, partial [Citrobacter youngae]|uniref:reverse transcriptase domain-containing protein n=1 Tax=Citrobacter youngae TaxID=133448 RepID=UPI0032DA9345